MTTLFLNTISVKPTTLATSTKPGWCCYGKKIKNKNNLVCCLNSEEIMRPSNSKALSPHKKGLLSYVLTKKEMDFDHEITTTTLTIPTGRDTKLKEKVSDGIGIVRSLSGKVLFITGATGFLAKVLVEKILRTIPDVGKIFLLIKARNKEAAMDRLKNEIINKELFNCLKQTHGRSYQAFMLSKLVPVVGNVCESNDLGIEPSLVDEITNQVDIMIHSAATTTFDESYDIALDTNTRGPSRLLSLAKKCNKLKLFMHVSTAYVNGQREGRILEKTFSIGDSLAREMANSETHKRSFQIILDIEAEIKMALKARETLEDNDQMTQKMKNLGLQRAKIFGWDDTYEFTKAMGEMLINKTRGEVPVVIVRPSIIEGTCKEPYPGWIEGIRMLDPLVLWHGRGRLTGFPVDSNGVFDVVPADMVVNAILAAAAKHGEISKPGIEVYHVASSAVNPLGTEDFFRFSFEHFISFPYKDSKGSPTTVQKMKLFNSLKDFYSHIDQKDTIQQQNSTEVAVADSTMSQIRFKNKLVEQSKHLARIYQPYMFYKGRFDNTNTEKLIEKMSEEEKESFGFDVRGIDWKDYICYIHLPGLRRNVLMGR